MIIAIISVGTYNAYLLLIKQTKNGQVKQTAALEGKQVIEEIKTADLNSVGTDYNMVLNDTTCHGTISYDDNGDKNIKFSTKDGGEYTKEITFKRTQTSSGDDVDLSDTQASDLEAAGIYKIYVAKDNETSKDYVTDNLSNINSGTELTGKSYDSGLKKLIISVYLDNEAADLSKEDIKICDYKAQKYFEKTKDISKGFVINFGKYRKEDNSIPGNVKVEINIFNNDTSNVPDIYIQKATTLNVEVNACKGKINLYNNRAEDETEVGNLYDITVNVKNDDGILFTGYSKQNIDGLE